MRGKMMKGVRSVLEDSSEGEGEKKERPRSGGGGGGGKGGMKWGGFYHAGMKMFSTFLWHPNLSK